jgi:hypothetical protein
MYTPMCSGKLCCAARSFHQLAIARADRNLHRNLASCGWRGDDVGPFRRVGGSRSWQRPVALEAQPPLQRALVWELRIECVGPGCAGMSGSACGLYIVVLMPFSTPKDPSMLTARRPSKPSSWVWIRAL